MRKIIEAEIMSEGQTPLKITLSSGDVIEGFSWGIMPEFDDDGEELDYNILAFKTYEPDSYFHLKDTDIVRIEVGSNPKGIKPYE